MRIGRAWEGLSQRQCLTQEGMDVAKSGAHPALSGELPAGSSRALSRRPHREGVSPDELAVRRQRRERLVSVFSPSVLLVLWELLARLRVLDTRFFPPPTDILETMLELVSTGQLIQDLGISLRRIFTGFLAGSIPGVFLGLTMGLFPAVRAALQPIVAALYPIPKIALLPLILLIFGLGEASKAAMIAIGVFFLVLMNTVAGVVNIPRIYLDVARNYGASLKDFYLTIAIPGSLPFIFTGIKLGLGMALLLIVAAEMIGAKSGIGYMIWTGYETFNLEQMFSGLIIMAFLGYVFDILLDFLEKRVIPWKN